METRNGMDNGVGSKPERAEEPGPIVGFFQRAIERMRYGEVRRRLLEMRARRQRTEEEGTYGGMHDGRAVEQGVRPPQWRAPGRRLPGDLPPRAEEPAFGREGPGEYSPGRSARDEHHPYGYDAESREGGGREASGPAWHRREHTHTGHRELESRVESYEGELYQPPRERRPRHGGVTEYPKDRWRDAQPQQWAGARDPERFVGRDGSGFDRREWGEGAEVGRYEQRLASGGPREEGPDERWSPYEEEEPLPPGRAEGGWRGRR